MWACFKPIFNPGSGCATCSQIYFCPHFVHISFIGTYAEAACYVSTFGVVVESNAQVTPHKWEANFGFECSTRCFNHGRISRRTPVRLHGKWRGGGQCEVGSEKCQRVESRG